MLLAVLANAEIYKWVDENGKVHFSDHASDVKAKAVGGTLKPANISQSEPVQEYGSEQPISAAEQQVEQRDEQQARFEEYAREMQCREARNQLRIISGPVYFEREDGSTFEISEQERVIKEKELRQAIADNCD